MIDNKHVWVCVMPEGTRPVLRTSVIPTMARLNSMTNSNWFTAVCGPLPAPADAEIDALFQESPPNKRQKSDVVDEWFAEFDTSGGGGELDEGVRECVEHFHDWLIRRKH